MKRKMNLFVDTLKDQNDSVFSPSEVTPDLVKHTGLNETRLKRGYLNENRRFIEEGVSYNRQNLVSQLSRQISQILMWEYSKSYHFVNEISNLLHFNSLEIVYWSFFIKHSTQKTFRPVLSIYFSAFLAKNCLNNDTSDYEYQLSEKIPNFKYIYDNWLLFSDSIPEPSLKEVNSRYINMIRKKTNKDNYEAIIDELMEVPGKKSKIENTRINPGLKIEKMVQELEDSEKSFFKGEVFSLIDNC